jgi:hypothetical protein
MITTTPGYSGYTGPSIAKLPRFIQEMILNPPRAGQGVNNYLFRLARLLHAFYDDHIIAKILWAATRDCGRVVGDREIFRAIENSKPYSWQPGVPSAWAGMPKWPEIDWDKRNRILDAGKSLPSLQEASPAQPGGDTETIIDALFPNNPLICAAHSEQAFATLSRANWRGRLAEMQFIVPNTMSAMWGVTMEGKPSARCLSNTGPRRFLVCEFDDGKTDDHATLLRYLEVGSLQLALVVFSGGKSLHGWFFCDGHGEDDTKVFMTEAVSVGADPATWTRCQLVRMPEGIRDNGNRQSVYYYNPAVISK